MKAFHITDFKGPAGLEQMTLPDPVPGPREALIRVRAASLNFRDLMMATGIYNPKQPLPLIPLSDGAGEVAAVGEGVTRVKVGDRVAGIFTQHWLDGAYYPEYWRHSTLGGPLHGMLTEYTVLDEQGLVHIPQHLSFEEAATLPCAGVTAWNALFHTGRLQPGETVVVLGTGGVSLFALQFAKLAGARVILTSSSDAKLARAKELGADVLINYTATPDWDRAVREATGGRGADHVVEVGGKGTLPKSFRAARDAGNIYVIGVLTNQNASDVDPMPILGKMLRVSGILVGSRAMFEAMNRAIEQSGLHPIVDRVFSFDEAPAALSYLQSCAHCGKIVIRIP